MMMFMIVRLLIATVVIHATVRAIVAASMATIAVAMLASQYHCDACRAPRRQAAHSSSWDDVGCVLTPLHGDIQGLADSQTKEL